MVLMTVHVVDGLSVIMGSGEYNSGGQTWRTMILHNVNHDGQ